jgi:hypothetical protein
MATAQQTPIGGVRSALLEGVLLDAVAAAYLGAALV